LQMQEKPRANAKGIDLDSPLETSQLLSSIASTSAEPLLSHSIIDGQPVRGRTATQLQPRRQ
jgi:hypothetical protein